MHHGREVADERSLQGFLVDLELSNAEDLLKFRLRSLSLPCLSFSHLIILDDAVEDDDECAWPGCSSNFLPTLDEMLLCLLQEEHKIIIIDAVAAPSEDDRGVLLPEDVVLHLASVDVLDLLLLLELLDQDLVGVLSRIKDVDELESLQQQILGNDAVAAARLQDAIVLEALQLLEELLHELDGVRMIRLHRLLLFRSSISQDRFSSAVSHSVLLAMRQSGCASTMACLSIQRL